MVERLLQTPEGIVKPDRLCALPIEYYDVAPCVHEKRVRLTGQAQSTVKQRNLSPVWAPAEVQPQHVDNGEEHFEFGRVRELQLSPVEVHLSVPVQKRSARRGNVATALPQLDNFGVFHLESRVCQKRLALLRPAGTFLHRSDRGISVEVPAVGVHEASHGAWSFDAVNPVLVHLLVEQDAGVSRQGM